MSGRTVCIIQARMTSTRLPGKVMLPLAGRPMLERAAERAARTPGVDAVCIAIPEGSAHQPLADVANAAGWIVARGAEHDVLRRYCVAADLSGADVVMRVTSDCPFIDPAVCAAVLAARRAQNVPYARTAIDTGFPIGLDVEVVTAAALREADAEAADPYEREHVSPFVWRRPERFGCLVLDRRPDRRNWRLTVDQPEDYRLAQAIYNEAFPQTPQFDFPWIERLLQSRPDMLEINAHIAKPTHVGWKPA
jgi:spore coat polysaccharide biosynthesis protein SpsF